MSNYTTEHPTGPTGPRHYLVHVTTGQRVGTFGVAQAAIEAANSLNRTHRQGSPLMAHTMGMIGRLVAGRMHATRHPAAVA